MADWSRLPYELLGEIVMRFDTIEDLVYFSIVCRLWNCFASMVKHEFRVKTTPWLLLAENTEDNPDSLRKVFNPHNNKCYQLKLPEIAGNRCWGSENGWIVTYDGFELHLFNLLTKLRISLPSRSCLPCECPDGEVVSRFIRKAFLLEVAEDKFVVFVTYFFPGLKLAYSRPGDQAWTSIEEPRRAEQFYGCHIVEDVLIHDAKLLFLYRDASIGYLNISDLDNPEIFTVDDYSLRSHIFPMILSDRCNNLGLKAREYVPLHHDIFWTGDLCGFYLVNLCSGLFIVVRDRDDSNEREFDYATLGFSVYQLEYETKTWSRVYSLGDDVALFVGNNSSISVRASGAVKCKSDCIYFTDDLSEFWDLPSSGNDMGGFSFGNAKLDDIYVGSDNCSKNQPPLWFKPRF